jgi:serine/threonine protein kinase
VRGDAAAESLELRPRPLLGGSHQNQNFSEMTKAFLTCEILTVTEALMDAKIIHADIKPDNFILIPIK